MWWLHGDRPRPLITSQEQQGPPLTVQGGQREAGEYHAAPQEGSRDDTAGEGGRDSEAHTHTQSARGRSCEQQQQQQAPGVELQHGIQEGAQTVACGGEGGGGGGATLTGYTSARRGHSYTECLYGCCSL